jgi:hypothetical protein
MTLPESLPARLYLLAYDTEKNRVTAQSRLGLVLRAAALADLYLAGRVTDENGKARATGDRRPTSDPLLDEVLQQVTEHRPRSWQGWIAHGQPAIRTVRTQLEAGRIIRVEHRRILPDRVELLDRIAVQRYADEVRAELRRPASRTEPRTAAGRAPAPPRGVSGRSAQHPARGAFPEAAPVAAKSSPAQSTGCPVRSASAYVTQSPKLSAAGCLPLPYLRHPLIARAASSSLTAPGA